MNRTARAVIGMVVLAGALSGCASNTPSNSDVQTAPTVVATTTPKPVPKPAGKTVLRMDGALTRHNVGKAVAFDQKTLDGMSTATATICPTTASHRSRAIHVRTICCSCNGSGTRCRRLVGAVGEGCRSAASARCIAIAYDKQRLQAESRPISHNARAAACGRRGSPEEDQKGF